MIPDVKVFW